MFWGLEDLGHPAWEYKKKMLEPVPYCALLQLVLKCKKFRLDLYLDSVESLDSILIYKQTYF